MNQEKRRLLGIVLEMLGRVYSPREDEPREPLNPVTIGKETFAASFLDHGKMYFLEQEVHNNTGRAHRIYYNLRVEGEAFPVLKVSWDFEQD